MRFLTTALFAASLLAGASWGQTTSAPASPKRPQVLHVPAIEVPPELARRGVQGEPVLRGMVQPDGTIINVEVVETSHSPELDEFAKTILLQVTFEPVVVDGVKVAAPYENAIALYKDHATNLRAKTCADLNVDVAYFLATFPDKPVKDMRVATISLGLLFTASYRGTMSVDAIKRSRGAFERTVSWCANHPSDLFFDSFVKMAK